MVCGQFSLILALNHYEESSPPSGNQMDFVYRFVISCCPHAYAYLLIRVLQPAVAFIRPGVILFRVRIAIRSARCLCAHVIYDGAWQLQIV